MKNKDDLKIEIEEIRKRYDENLKLLTRNLKDDLLETIQKYPTALPYICELKEKISLLEKENSKLKKTHEESNLELESVWKDEFVNWWLDKYVPSAEPEARLIIRDNIIKDGMCARELDSYIYAKKTSKEQIRLMKEELDNASFRRGYELIRRLNEEKKNLTDLLKTMVELDEAVINIVGKYYLRINWFKKRDETLDKIKKILTSNNP